MSRETDSALTPEEWRMRGFHTPTLAADGNIREYGDEWDGRLQPDLFVDSMGTLAIADPMMYHQGWVTDARKVMALANLSLTLENRPGAIKYSDVEVCISAAWYFRKLARELISHADGEQDAEQKSAFLDHAASLTAGNVQLFELANTLRRLVPPE